MHAVWGAGPLLRVVRAPGLQIWNNATAAAQKQLTNIVTREISTLLLSVIQNPGSIVNQCMASLKGMQVGALHHTPPLESRTGLYGAYKRWSLISVCGKTPAWAHVNLTRAATNGMQVAW